MFLFFHVKMCSTVNARTLYLDITLPKCVKALTGPQDELMTQTRGNKLTLALRGGEKMESSSSDEAPVFMKCRVPHLLQSRDTGGEFQLLMEELKLYHGLFRISACRWDSSRHRCCSFIWEDRAASTRRLWTWSNALQSVWGRQVVVVVVGDGLDVRSRLVDVFVWRNLSWSQKRKGLLLKAEIFAFGTRILMLKQQFAIFLYPVCKDLQNC